MRPLWNWFRRGQLENSLERELRYHLDRRVSDLTAAGVPESEALRQAQLEIGGLTQVQEAVRDVWLSRWLRDFVYDLRFSARSFLRSPSFTITVILSLALGIGATTAIYSLVDQVLRRALPVREPERLVLVDWKGDQVAGAFGSFNLMSYPLCRDLQLHDRVFDGVLCRALTTVNLSTGGDHEPASAEIVSGSYFRVLGVDAAIGRVLTDEDAETPGANPVVVVAYDFWKTRLASAPDVIGRKVLINHYPMTVVGVAAPTFRGIDVGEVPAIWIPASMAEQAIPGFTALMTDRRTRWVQVLGRLRAGVTLTQARAALQPWFKARLDEDSHRPEFPRIPAERRQRFFASTLELTPAPQGHAPLRRRLSQPLWVLFAATGALLALACLNVAGLFLARGSARTREISTRLALGASRGRIGRQLLADSVLLALAGGALGAAVAPVIMRALIAFLPREIAANALRSDLDARLLLFALLVSAAAGVLSGCVPALKAGRESSLVPALRDRSGVGGGAGLRKAIVTLEMAFSLILVIGAVSFVLTLTDLLAKGPGFDTPRLVSVGLDPRKNGYSPTQTSQFIRRMHDEIRSLPGVETSAVARNQLLTGGSWNNVMTIQTDQRMTTDRDVQLNAVSPGFFATLGIRLLAGRDFDQRDSRPVGESGDRSAIVNDTFVKRYLAGRNPLGVRIGLGSGPDAKVVIEIVGVVADFNYRGLRDQTEQAYFPIFDGRDGIGHFYVKTRGTPEEAFAAIRAIVKRADPAFAITYLRTVDEQVSRSLNTERMLATLSAVFGGIALLLALVGLYGVMSFVVTRRTREIGIRMALGATKGSAIRLILRDAATMIAGGIAIALPCLGMVGRLVESQLFGVRATDPGTIVQATVVLTAAALAAAFIPAYRASAVSPTSALRLE